MRIRAYLRVVGLRDEIQRIGAAEIPRSKTLPLKAKTETGDVYWTWQTEAISLNLDDVDEGLYNLLSAYRSFFGVIRTGQPETDIYLQMVSEYAEGEEPCGLAVSAKTIQLLSELGGALDNDCVYLLNPMVPVSI